MKEVHYSLWDQIPALFDLVHNRAMRMTTKTILFLSLMAMPALLTASVDPWEAWRFLIGNWETVAKTGEGTGGFSLVPDLDCKVLVRRNHAEYPASEGRPAVVHDDLMIVHPDAGGPPKAVYFDNEGHIIHYAVVPSEPGTVVLLSEPRPSTPCFRLTYVKKDAETVKVRFEMAPSGTEKDLKLYLEGEVRRIIPSKGAKP